MFPVRHRCDSREPTMVPNALKEAKSLKKMERAMGFEPTTSTLARLRSTPELRPHIAPPRNGAPIIAPGRPFSRPLLRAHPPVFHLGTGVRAASRRIPIDNRAAFEKTVSLRWQPGRFICFASKAVETPTADKNKDLETCTGRWKKPFMGK